MEKHTEPVTKTLYFGVDLANEQHCTGCVFHSQYFDWDDKDIYFKCQKLGRNLDSIHRPKDCPLKDIESLIKEWMA